VRVGASNHSFTAGGRAFNLVGFVCTQVLNHGIDDGLIAEVMAVAREFFRLPAEEKAKLYSDDPARKIRLSTSFNVRKETVHNWRDYLRLHCHPLDQFVPDWPSNPPDFKYANCLASSTLLFNHFVVLNC
jgi:isopenicillin N synthase-like dioxygenase